MKNDASLSSENSIDELIGELQKASGLPLTLDEGSLGNDEQQVRRKLESLLFLYRNALDRNELLMRFLTGQLDEDAFISAFPHFRSAKEKDNAGHAYGLLVVSFKNGADEAAMPILSGMFPAPKNLIGKAGPDTLIVITESREPDDEELSSAAMAVYDTLSSEALIAVRVGYDRMVSGVKGLPGAYANAKTALRIAGLFSMDEPCPGYRTLGLSKLLSRIPQDACREYLDEEFGGYDFSSLSAETVNTINTLFDNGLNIAEASRSMYVHRNTLVYRIEKFSRESGLDLRNFDDAVKCRMGMLLAKLLNTKGE